MKITGTVTPDGKDAPRVDYGFDAWLSGFELRDLFAAFALAGMVSVDDSQLGKPEGTARDCYLWADAMLKARATARGEQ